MITTSATTTITTTTTTHHSPLTTTALPSRGPQVCLRTYVIMTCPVAPQVLAEGESNVMHGSVRLNNVACAGYVEKTLCKWFMMNFVFCMFDS
jgi:hypothetical protein